MPTYTSNYAFAKPNVNSVDDEDLWGNQTNDNWDSLDSSLKTATDSVTRSLTADASITTSDRNKLILCDASGGAIELTLPAASAAGDGFTIIVKKTDTGSNALTLTPDGSETIDGLSSIDIALPNDTRTLTSNGSNWFLQNRGSLGVVGDYVDSAATTRAGALLCNGSAVSRTTYAALFNAIGTSHGKGDGSTTFNIPDLRGKFKRMQDHGAGNDPDAATRTAMATGGNTGDAVGSVQGDEFRAHTHGMATSMRDTNAIQPTVVSGGSNVQTASAGGHETRPINVYVNTFIIY